MPRLAIDLRARALDASHGALALVVLAALGPACSDKGSGLSRNGGHDDVRCDADADCADAFAELGACQTAVCGDDGVCAIGARSDGSECHDGLACTSPDYCLQGVCTGTAVRCEDFDACTLDLCDNKSGCLHIAQSDVACDDADPCTVGDTCHAGTCDSGSLTPGCCHYDGDCDDGDPCSDDRCGNGVCAHTPNRAPCDDGDRCTAPDHCDGAGACGGEPLLCEDGNPCTLDACDPATGACVNGPADDGTTCEDGNACTVGDACQGGECLSGPSACECASDADCAALEDDDLCNGTLRCTGSRCEIDPLTVARCNPTGDTTCAASACDPASGQCRPIAAEDGLACDDQNPCTTFDHCADGVCAGTPLACDDDNPCTFDACSPASGCQYTDNNQPCSDGSACTANDQCDGGACIGVALGCDDHNPCTDDSCDDAIGCEHKPNAATCEDGDACTSGDVCANGVCQAGASHCGPCSVDGDCAVYEDGNACNGTLACLHGICALDAATVVTCDTSGDTICRRNRCDPATGRCGDVLASQGAACSDGSACTTADACAAGACVGRAVDCDDGDPCTNDSCDPATGCKHVAHSSACDDGNACTTGDVCDHGVCAGAPRTCDDANPCTIDGCDPLVGCTARNAQDGLVCDDASLCTSADHCAAGKCTGTALVCVDTNPCTSDLCVPTLGCSFPASPSTKACDDGNACTGNDHCSAKTCVGTPVVCDDDNSCTVDSCDPSHGCTVASVLGDGEPCDDGSACTDGDKCAGGACVPGAIVCVGCQLTPCADPGPCTKATCDLATGDCIVSADNDNGACNDNNACTDADRCTAGTCSGSPKTCDDNNPCTIDSCAPATGCTFTRAPNGFECPDADLCDGTETCVGGRCTGVGVALTCNDGNPCTANTCVPATGCAYPAVANGASCADADLCDGAEKCQGGVCTNGVALSCDDHNACTNDACTAASGACTHSAIPGCAPEVTCNGPLTTTSDPDGNAFDPVLLVGNVGAAGSGGVRYAWVVTSAPTGSTAKPVSPGASATTFTPDIVGTYTITLTVTDSSGAHDECATVVNAVPSEQLRIELVWDEPWGDVDLHLLRPGAAGRWFDGEDDCYFLTCTGSFGLDWGVAGSDGDVTLDHDDTDGFGPEVTNIDTAPEAGTYTIGVSYYCQHSAFDSGDPDDGPSVATVRVSCKGTTTEIGGLALAETGVFLIVGTVTWPGCVVTPKRTTLYVGDVESGSDIPARCDYFPCDSNDDCLSGEVCDTDFEECTLDGP